jgi:thymidylate kinase
MISFSGIDGAGKSTQIELVKDHFDKQGIKYIMIWGRGGWTPGLELIKNIVRTDKKLDKDGRENYRISVHANPRKKKLLLIGAILDLYFYFGIYYRYLNIRGIEVICDRYIWDTYIDFKVNYSMFNFEKWIIWKMLLVFIPYPSKSIILVISTEESTQRCKSKIDDYTESEEIRKYKIDLYYDMINKKKWTHVINGCQTIDKIFSDIKEALIK